MVFVLALGSALLSCKSNSSKDAETSDRQKPEETNQNSHLYTQTNETANAVIHYSRNEDGSLNEIERVLTGGKGTNGFKPTTGETSAPDPLLSASSVIVADGNKMLFVANAHDNTVSVFKISEGGTLILMDNKPSGERGSLNSLAYNANNRVLYALHSFGPNHIRMFRVDSDMKLSLMDQNYTVNTPEEKDRIPTQIIISPDNKFVLVDVLFNARPKGGDNGPILYPSNAGTGDGVVVFPVLEAGTLGESIINDSGTPTPFSLSFLRGSNNMFINTFAAGNGAGLSKLEADGEISNIMSTTVSLDQAPQGPSETCWVSIDPDNKYAYAANFGFGTISSFEILPNGLKLKADKMAKVEDITGFQALAGIPTSGPADNWMSGDGYFYQLYGSAGVLVAYKAEEGRLTEVGRYEIPVNSTQGLAGF